MRDYASNITLLTDFYELMMINGYNAAGVEDQIGYFDYYFRTLPDGAGYAITCGLTSFIDYIENLNFTDEDIEFLRTIDLFSDDFLIKLKAFKFTGDIWAMPEGTPIFPNEPIIVVRSTMFEAQLIETALLLLMNHQSLICTKSNRMTSVTGNKAVLEFGARRAQGVDAAVLGARAAYIGGCVGTSNTMAGRYLGVPASGTMAHSWVQLFDSEYESFKQFAQTYPDNTILLVDTYDVLKSGIPNAIKTFDEVLKPLGKRPKGIRLDSGDIAYLSKKAREMLDEAGYKDCMIMASNSLDEYLIRDLMYQGAKIDAFGIGERLITSKTWPVFGGVYKLVGTEINGKFVPKIKLSENVVKITTPGFKQVFRLFNRETDAPIADVVTLFDEEIDDSVPYEIFDPVHTWKRKTITDFYAKKMLVQIFDKGQLCYDVPDIYDIKGYCKSSVDKLWEEIKRFEFPHKYYVDLSQSVWDLKQSLLKVYKKDEK